MEARPSTKEIPSIKLLKDIDRADTWQDFVPHIIRWQRKEPEALDAIDTRMVNILHKTRREPRPVIVLRRVVDIEEDNTRSFGFYADDALLLQHYIGEDNSKEFSRFLSKGDPDGISLYQ